MSVMMNAFNRHLVNVCGQTVKQVCVTIGACICSRQVPQIKVVLRKSCSQGLASVYTWKESVHDLVHQCSVHDEQHSFPRELFANIFLHKITRVECFSHIFCSHDCMSIPGTSSDMSRSITAACVMSSRVSPLCLSQILRITLLHRSLNCSQASIRSRYSMLQTSEYQRVTVLELELRSQINCQLLFHNPSHTIAQVFTSCY